MATRTNDKKINKPRSRKTKPYKETFSDFCASAWLQINNAHWDQNTYRISAKHVLEFRKGDEHEPEPIEV